MKNAAGIPRYATFWGMLAWLCLAAVLGTAMSVAQSLSSTPFCGAAGFRIAVPYAGWVVLFPVISAVARRFPLGRGRMLRSLAVHIPAAAACVLLTESVCGLLGLCCECRTLHAPVVAYDLFVYFALFSTVSAGHTMDGIQESERRRSALETELGRARFRVYRCRLPEWFLTRTFDSLRGQILRKADAGEALLLSFAAFLRALIEGVSAGRWSLEREIGLVALHAELEAARTGNAAGVSVDSDSDVLLEEIASGDLQSRLFQSDPGKPPVGGMIRIAADRQQSGAALDVSVAVPGQTPIRVSLPIVHPMGPVASPAGPRRAPVSPHAYATAVLGVGAMFSIAAQVLEQQGREGPIVPGFFPFATFRYLVPMLLGVGAGLIVRKLTEPGPGRMFSYLAAATLAAIAGEYSSFTILYLAGGPVPPPLSPHLAAIALSSIGPPLILCFSFLLALEDVLLRNERHARELRALELERQVWIAQLELLRGQLHPHFLFNALNSLAALLRSDRAAAARMLDRLRAFYSRADSFEGRPVITLAEELELIGEYVAIERVRFGARLVIELDVDPAAEPAVIPTLLLQPLVENAIKYGVRQGGPSTIRIEVRRSRSEVVMNIVNRGAPGMSEEKGTGLGLRNSSERLAQMFGSRASLSASRRADGTATVSLRIPFVLLGGELAAATAG